MSSPDPLKVTVRVDVVVEGGQVQPVQTTVEDSRQQLIRQLARPLVPLIIHYPLPSSSGSPNNTTVYPVSGQNYIEANGNCLTMSGSFPSQVWAMAYPNPSINPSMSGYATPTSGAVMDTPTTGGWSFTRTKGNPIPGATYDSISGGPNNSTVIVWYYFGGSPAVYSTEYTPFHGYLASISGGSGSVNHSGTHGSVKLHATFTGTLSALGTVHLVWNGSIWFATPSGVGGSVLTFARIGSEYILILAGTGMAFTVTGATKSTSPFVWSGIGTAVGPVAGQFGVTITE